MTEAIHDSMASNISTDEYRKILRKSNCLAKLHVLVDNLATNYEEAIKEKDRNTEIKEIITE